MVSAFSRVANHDLNLEMFSPEQRIFVHDFLWNRIRSNLPSNFSASLAQFVPNLLVQQIVSFVPVNESEITYELKEEDFHFLVETDSHDTVAQNETIDLDSILPKIVSHARVENFFGIPTNFFRKRMDLYKITGLPLFINETKALYTANLPRYLALGEDGSSTEWSDDANRRCTVDEKSRYTFCTIPLPIFTSIQQPCIRSVLLHNSTKDCFKETIELSSPHVVKFASNIHAISVHSSLQCFEKGDKEHKNVYSNITRVALVRTRCNSFVSCGAFDFSTIGNACDRVESYMFSFNNASENPFRLDKSINPVDIVMDKLSPMMDIPSLIESALSHKKHLEDTHVEFESNIHRTIRTKGWAKIFIVMFVFVLIVAIIAIIFASKDCLKKIYSVISSRKNIEYLFRKCFSKKQFHVDGTTRKICVQDSSLSQKDICLDLLPQENKNINQSQPLMRNVVDDYLPLTTHKSSPIDSSKISSPKIILKKTNSARKKIYEYVPESSDLFSNISSITSRDSFEENYEIDE